jgi:ribosomal protein L14E/L6E/L27E
MAIKPLDEKLISITGAKEPTGIPTKEIKEKAPSMPRHKSAKNRAKRARNQNKFNKGGSGKKRSFSS